MQTNIPNKTITPKYPRLNEKQRFMGKECLKWSGLIQDRGRQPKNKRWKHRPRNAWACAFEIIKSERFQEVIYFFFQQLHYEKEHQHKMSDEGYHYEA